MSHPKNLFITKELRQIVIKGNNYYNCNLTGGLCLRAKNSFISLKCETPKAIITLKKISGNGKVFIDINGFIKEYTICNIQPITIPVNQVITISRDHNSIGEISLIRVELLTTESIEQQQKKEQDRKDRIQQQKENMAVIDNPKLYNDYMNYDEIKDKRLEEAIAVFITKLKNKNITIPKFYGESNKVINEVVEILKGFKNKFVEIYNQKTDHEIIVLDHAGIGDVVHSRMVVQNIKNKKILWIMPSKYTNLYKDDKVADVVGSEYVRFRNPWCKFCKSLVNMIHKIFTTVFGAKFLINIPYNVTNYLAKKPLLAFDQVWFEANKMQRDYSIKFELQHNAKLEDLGLDLEYNKYLVIEHCSLTFGSIAVRKYEALVSKMKNIGYNCVCVGGLNDPKIKGAVDCRGYSLYDTFNLIKNSAGFVGRASGNECLVFFDDRIPVFEVGLDKKYCTLCKYMSDPKRAYLFNEYEFADSITNFYKEQNG